MDAIEELRKYISELSYEMRDGEGTWVVREHGDPRLTEIADRIEAEYVELPRDCNGEIINVGDEVSDEVGHMATVMGFDNSGYVIVENCNSGMGVRWRASTAELAKPYDGEEVE